VGLFSKWFGGGKRDDRDVDKGSDKDINKEPASPPVAVVVLRRGMNLPDAAYIEGVIARVFSGGLPESVQRFGLSQPTWFKSEEIADNIAQGVVETFAPKLALGDGVSSRRYVIDGPDGCACLLVELRRD
jgi:hypothetical protein